MKEVILSKSACLSLQQLYLKNKLPHMHFSLRADILNRAGLLFQLKYNKLWHREN